MTKRIYLYVHRDKDSNATVAEKIGLNGQALSRFLYACSEVELVCDVNMITGECDVVAADGRYLGDEKVSNSDVEQS